MKLLVPVFAFVAVLSGVMQSRQAPVSFFRPIQTTLAEHALTGAASADFNNDGLPDLVVGAAATGTVHVSLGGRRGFGAPAEHVVGTGRGHVATGDVNNDGAADVVAAGGGIVVLPGNGDGTFQAPIASFGSAVDPVLADFDGDGRLDLASVGKNSTAAIPDTVDVYAGLGNGTFGPPQTIFTSDNDPAALAAADFNGDGLVDLTFGVRNIRQLQIYLNTGGLIFAASASAFINVGPSQTRTGDVDGNGTVDVVTADFAGTVSWFPGNGDGTLGTGRAFPVASGASASAMWVELADLDADGALDIVTANQQPGSASVLINDGSGGFGAPTLLGVGSYAYAALAADYDADGTLDLAVTNGDAAFLETGARVVSTFLSKSAPRGSKRRD